MDALPVRLRSRKSEELCPANGRLSSHGGVRVVLPPLALCRRQRDRLAALRDRSGISFSDLQPLAPRLVGLAGVHPLLFGLAGFTQKAYSG